MTQPLRADYEWCRRQLRHYENFQVVSWFVPRMLRPHFWAVYAFCRSVDDLGDEWSGDRRAALDDFADQLDQALAGSPRSPLFRALAHTVEVRQLPHAPFYALIDANRRDQAVHAYSTFDDLLGYCALSANPVGQLVLALWGQLDDVRRSLSDATCTALQLTNFWQDLAFDLERGRCYVPLDELAAEGLGPESLRQRPEHPAVRRVLYSLRQRTWGLYREGARLEALVPARLRLQLRLYRLGGETVLRYLDQAANPWARPRLTRADRLKVAWQALAGGVT